MASINFFNDGISLYILKMPQIFPIRTDTACLLKWGWSTIYLDSGLTNSCHRCQKHSFDLDDFGTFHNTASKIENRKDMLQGKWPTQGCQYCQNHEKSGGISDRQFQLSEQRDPGLTAPELHTDAAATHVTPTMIEVYFNNTCNMKCLYCGPHFSSLWEQELNQHGPMDVKFNVFNRTPIGDKNYEKALSGLWQWLDQDGHYRHLRRFGMLGGEPFLQKKEIDQLIDFWDHHPNPDLTLYFITNLNIPESVMEKYFDRLDRLVKENKVWRVQFTASLDCWGVSQEYVRFPLDLNTWNNNFETLISQDWATISVNSAISGLTIKSMPELATKINEWNLKKKIETDIIWSFNTVESSPDRPYFFGKGTFTDDFMRTMEIMPDKTESDRNIKEYMRAIMLKIDRFSRNSYKIKELKEYLDILDQRRNTDWRKTFPWLIDIE